eukprot:485280-Rhodomonas_salina.2
MVRRKVWQRTHDRKLGSGKSLSCVARRAVKRRKHCRKRVSAVAEQSMLRRLVARVDYRTSIRAAQQLEGACRMHPPRQRYLEKLKAMVHLHRAARGILGRRGHSLELTSGANLQAVAKESIHRHKWCEHVGAVIQLYCAFKRIATRRPLVLKMAKLLPIQLLASLDWGDIFHLALSARICLFQAGEVMIKNKDSGDSMFVMLSGKVEIIIDLPNGKQLTVAHLTEGMAVGEMSLLTGAPRGATVAAEETTQAIEIRFASGLFCVRGL